MWTSNNICVYKHIKQWRIAINVYILLTQKYYCNCFAIVQHINEIFMDRKRSLIFMGSK